MGRRQRQQNPLCSSNRQHHCQNQRQRELSTTTTSTTAGCTSLFVFAAFVVLSHHCVLAEYAQNVAPQVPNVIDALYNFGNPPLATDYMYLMKNAVPGVTFPTHGYIPYTSFGCEQVWAQNFLEVLTRHSRLNYIPATQVPHPGYFADVETDCQVFRRCDHRGDMTSYLCPNGTLYNQLTLVCDWWFNVDCARAREFYSYANPRLNNRYVQLHDNKLDGYGGGGGGGLPPPPPPPLGGGGYGGGPIPAIPIVPVGPPVSIGYGKAPIGYGPPPPPPLPYEPYGSSISVAVGSPSGGGGGSGGGGTAAYGQAPASASQGSYGSPANRVQYRRSTAQKAAQDKNQQASSSAASELTPKAVSVTGGGTSSAISSSSGAADHVANASEQSNVISSGVSSTGAVKAAAEMIAASRQAHQHHPQQQLKA